MICEFALTPQIFDPSAHPDVSVWKARIQRLVGDMLPRTGHQPVCVSDLYDGSWQSSASQITSLCDEAVRGDLKKLFMRVADLCVTRDAEGDWPDSEDQWAAEALISSQKRFRINRIWTSADCFSRMGDPQLTSVADVEVDSCWNEVRPSKMIGMSIPAQVKALEPIAFHSTWLGFVSPYIYGTSSDDEMTLALQLLHSAVGYQQNRVKPRPVLLDIHTEAPVHVQNVIANLQPRLPAASPAFQMRMFFWQFEMKDRFLMAGEADDRGHAMKQQRLRWIVAPNHVARDYNNHKGLKDTPFQLLPRFEITKVFNDYYGAPPPIPIERLR
jgi:hypothetical protein